MFASSRSNPIGRLQSSARQDAHLPGRGNIVILLVEGSTMKELLKELCFCVRAWFEARFGTRKIASIQDPEKRKRAKVLASGSSGKETHVVEVR